MAKKKKTVLGKGNSRDRYTKDQVLAALEAAGGFITKAAAKLGCSTMTVHNYLNKYPDLREAKLAIDDQYLDLAEEKLLSLIRRGSLGAIIFMLKCKGRERGWIERQTITGPDDTPLKIKVTISDDDMD